MLRKKVLKSNPAKPRIHTGELDIASIAAATVTSEDSGHPLENALDDQRGPGASQWVAEDRGEQAVVLAFDAPQTVRRVLLEVEERQTARTQRVELLVSRDNEQTYQELLRQEFNFSPPGTTFEREQWTVNAEGITHLQVRITPDIQGGESRAKLTALAIW